MMSQTWIDPRVNRSDWGPGRWDGEPDKVVWEAQGLPCLAKRHFRWGNWCGYVGVPWTHPLYGRSYDDVEVDIHGGLTYSAACQDGPIEQSICHPDPTPIWWFGFDCAHAGDVSPGLRAILCKYAPEYPFLEGEVYCDLKYVTGECFRLATQLKDYK